MFGVRLMTERDPATIGDYRRLLILVDGCAAERSTPQSGDINHDVDFRYASRIWSEVPTDQDFAAMSPDYLTNPPVHVRHRSSRRRYSSPSPSPRRSYSPRRPAPPPSTRMKSFASNRR
ncbi:hypothetical protein L198_03511 [Cryptococcus wingfieldii CBS 7118]|uniref:Uncharacterized protein n=1 Tax=Cryptococcus wingfieldii CBS 7118 TaxID=1295528 RepID=A0A1E3JBL2_9TREE|nr:hypothetical protein L198_03511 [Cryptococcus wingfieldii CBS 7118]ODN98268.1 hypothetical protein L198_03511 [Cryptococcus wingfieldii CBS 7118]